MLGIDNSLATIDEWHCVNQIFILCKSIYNTHEQVKIKDKIYLKERKELSNCIITEKNGKRSIDIANVIKNNKINTQKRIVGLHSQRVMLPFFVYETWFSHLLIHNNVVVRSFS